MPVTRLLIANRGEIAVRIARSAAELGIATVAVFSEDDAGALHVARADAAQALAGVGAAAYLDLPQLVAAAQQAGCDAVHPGYGFASERAEFARRCEEAELTFVGPRAETLALLGDKLAAKALAARLGVPVLRGTGDVDLEEAQGFLGTLAGAPAVVKAVAGGGGRGMRVVRGAGELGAVWQRCRAEAQAAFGDGRLFVERLVERARHLEVQVLGDGREVVHLWERDCSLQRRHQKLVELAPAPGLPDALRAELTGAAVRMARAVGYRSAGTFEFLLDVDGGGFVFLEANPRLQVEHPVTEAVTGVDLVALQLAVARGCSLAALGLVPQAVAPPRGLAMELRVNCETMAADGTPLPQTGVLAVFEPPAGPGVRVDSAAHVGHAPNPRFDSLLAKVVVHVPSADLARLIARARRALGELEIDGVATNASFLCALLERPEVAAGRLHTRLVDELTPALVAAAQQVRRPRRSGGGAGRVGARVDARDPLAVLAHGKTQDARAATAPSATVAVAAPLQGTVVSVDVRSGERVHAGQQLLVMEAMKMEHVIAAPVGGVVLAIAVAEGDAVAEGYVLVRLEEGAPEAADRAPVETSDPDAIRPDLAETIERHAVGLDARRPEAVARRRATGQRTARENVADLCDPDSFVEYGALVVAAQRRRRPLDELVRRTPADGLIAGIGRVNGAPCVVMSYDYTVLAGTQGAQNHRKKDRLFELTESLRLPLVLFAEGGGGRPGDTDGLGVTGLDCAAFQWFARLSGLVPLVGIASGRCFAGNAALLGCCDVVIATRGANIGMGGPAMIEGGGLGVFRPDEVGPLDVQTAGGVVDVAVADEAAAVEVAKRYLTYFRGPAPAWRAPDQRRLRTVVPENRLRTYDVRRVLHGLADEGAVLELRHGFGRGMVTALARVEGRPLGVIANDPTHLAGAIDAPGADKAARFMQLCDAFDLPILFLCDTPGIMVGPEVEKTGLVRHAARMFVVGASLSVPFCTVVLRKGYGLGAQAMAGGSFKAPVFTVAWPTGEFGGMGLEGAVKLGFRGELAAIDDPAERRRLFDEMVARMYEHGKAVNVASHFEIDDVIDPADTRAWIVAALAAAPPTAPRTGKKRPCVDPW